MLVRLMYASRANEPVKSDTVTAIHKQSTAYNHSVGVTGVLCFSGDVWLQVLEGGRSQVSALYNRIARDPRHRDVVLLSYAEIHERNFAGWAMGQADLGRCNPALLMRYSATSTLDPYAVSAKASEALFAELVATASVMA